MVQNIYFFFKFLIELDPQLIFKKHTENKNYIQTANTFSSFCFQVLPTYFNNPLSVLKGHEQTYSYKVKINKRTKWNDSEFYLRRNQRPLSPPSFIYKWRKWLVQSRGTTRGNLRWRLWLPAWGSVHWSTFIQLHSLKRANLLGHHRLFFLKNWRLLLLISF